MKKESHQAKPSMLSAGGLSFVVRAYSLLAVISLAIFGALHVANGELAIGYIEMVGSVLILANLGLMWMTGNEVITRDVFLLLVLIYLGVMLITGGIEHTGIFWYFVFPVIAFFLTDKRRGIWWMGALVAVTCAIWLLAATGVTHIDYDSITIRQLFVSV